HRTLGLHAGGGGLHRLGPADLRAVRGDHRVQRHVLGLERRHFDALSRQPTTDARGDDALTGVRRRAGDEQAVHPTTTATATATTSAAAPTRRDSRAARSTSSGSGARPSPRTPRTSTRPAYTLVPPSRTPSAPANAASTGPAFGLGCADASLRTARNAARG